MTIDDLVKKLKAKAKEEGHAEEYPPLSANEVARCEKEMGVQLPEIVRLVYTQVANGGIGPGGALIGLKGGFVEDNDEDVTSLYQAWMKGSNEVWEDFDDEANDVKMEWVPGLLPVCLHGCTVWTLLNCNAPGGRLIYADLSGPMNYKQEWETDSGVFQKPGVPFEEWIAAWLDDERQWQYVPGGKPKPPEKYVPPPEPPRAEDQLEGESHKAYKLRRAAETGDPQAQFDYGMFWLEGSWDFTRNGGRGFQWLEKAAEQGHPQACQHVARAYKDGLGGTVDWERAVAFAEKAGTDVRKFYYLGPDKHLGTKPRPDWNYTQEWWQQATQWWQKQMNTDADAAYSFGLAHDLKLAPNANSASAAEGYKRAYELGHVLGLSNLAAVTKDPEWLEKAAAVGDEPAQYDLWQHYSENDRDWKTALKYLKGLAAKARSSKTLNEITARAAVDLAQLYLAGKQVEHDTAKAIDLLERAAKLADRRARDNARYILGKLYMDDAKVRDPEKAAHWFGKGRDMGDINCFYELACCYEQGLGVPQSLSRACTLFDVAASRGHEEAAKRLEELRARMS